MASERKNGRISSLAMDSEQYIDVNMEPALNLDLTRDNMPLKTYNTAASPMQIVVDVPDTEDEP